MLDQRIGGVQNIAAGAVVLLQLDRLGHLKVRHQPAHIAHFGTPEGIDRLVIVADGKHAGVRAGKQGKPGILQLVGVLELVHQNMRKPCPIMLTQGFVAAEQLVAAQQQLGKIHHAFAPALGVVGGVKFSQLGVEGIMGLQRLGTQTLVFMAVDERLHLARWKFLVRHLQGFHQPLDRRQLVLHVEDGKRLRQAGIAPVGAQKTVGQAVKGANPHAARIDRQHDRQAGVHFPGGLVGKGHRQNIGRHGALPGNQPGNPRGQHPGFAAASPGQHQRRPLRQSDRAQLFRIQAGQMIGKHALPTSIKVGILPDSGGRTEACLLNSNKRLRHDVGHAAT